MKDRLDELYEVVEKALDRLPRVCVINFALKYELAELESKYVRYFDKIEIAKISFTRFGGQDYEEVHIKGIPEQAENFRLYIKRRLINAGFMNSIVTMGL